MHAVIYKGELWNIIGSSKSINNGSPQWILKRKKDGMPTVANAGDCEVFKG